MTYRSFRVALLAALFGALLLLGCSTSVHAQLPQKPVVQAFRVHSPLDPADSTRWTGDTHKIVWRIRIHCTNYFIGTDPFRRWNWSAEWLRIFVTANWVNADGSPGMYTNRPKRSGDYANIPQLYPNLKQGATGTIGNNQFWAERVGYFSSRMVDATTLQPVANSSQVSVEANFLFGYYSKILNSDGVTYAKRYYSKTLDDYTTIPVNLTASAIAAPAGDRYAALFPRQQRRGRRVHGPHAPESLGAMPLVPLQPRLIATMRIAGTPYAVQTYDESGFLTSAQAVADTSDIAWVAAAVSDDTNTTAGDTGYVYPVWP